MRIGILSVLVTILLASPLAAAQDFQVQPSLTINGLPTEVQGLASNATVTVPFSVDYALQGNFLCPQPATVPITISLQSGQSPFITASVEPAEATVTITQGPHQNGGGKVDGTLTVVLTEINANASVPMTITATAGGVTSCQPTWGGAEATATTYANVTYEAPPPPTPPPVEESPGFGAVLAVLAVVGVAVALRRRRSA